MAALRTVPSAAALLCALALIAVEARAQSPARVDNRTPAGDAAAILDPGGGVVLRWARPPSVIAFVRTPAERAAIDEKLTEIESLIGAPLPPGQMITAGRGFVAARFADAAPLSDPARTLEIKVLRRADGDARIQLTLGEGRDARIFDADLMLFIAPTPGQRRLADARRSRKPAFWEGAARGEIPCFFEAARPRGAPVLDYAFVLLNPDGPEYDLTGCVHEELYQSMGLPKDAVGSPFFSFDNSPIAKDQRLDRLLLRALYAPEIKLGASVLEVIRVFDRLRRAQPQ